MNLRQVRKKIKTIANVKKITRAMELVSAVKMKKSQQEALESRPYADLLDQVIKKVTKVVDRQYSKLLQSNPSPKKLAIVISTNKGLCGAFNFNLFRFLLKMADWKKHDFVTVGKKAGFFISRLGGKVIADFSAGKAIDSVSAIFNLAVGKFLAGEYQQVIIVYNRFVSAVRYEPVLEMVLPVKMEKQEQDNVPEDLGENYLIEPDPQSIIDDLLKNVIEVKIRGTIISSEAGEHSARMLAMKNATENASDLMDELTLTGNRLRQEKITNELLDMVTAKESVE